MIIHCDNGAALVLDQCWTEGAYLAVNHFGGAGAVLDLATIGTIRAELERIEASILDQRQKQGRKAA
jgi:hypothetical protein